MPVTAARLFFFLCVPDFNFQKKTEKCDDVTDEAVQPNPPSKHPKYSLLCNTHFQVLACNKRELAGAETCCKTKLKTGHFLLL